MTEQRFGLKRLHFNDNISVHESSLVVFAARGRYLKVEAKSMSSILSFQLKC